MQIKNRKEFEEFSSVVSELLDKQKKKVLICAGTGCVAGGSLEIYEKIKSMVEEKGLLVDLQLQEENEGDGIRVCQCVTNAERSNGGIGVKKSGCHGFCEMGPLIKIEPFNYLYVKVSINDCEEIVEKTLMGNEPVERLMYSFEGKSYATRDEIPFYKEQTRLVLDHCGSIDAESLREYVAKGGYKTFVEVLSMQTPEQVCKTVLESNLRGRGGGGYPTGRKWQQVLAQSSEIKYVVCNGDEGDPGAFMDRSVMEGDPHRVIEGMLIAGYATKSTEGYIYVRAEYPLAVERLRIAIEDASNYGLLGENILDLGFSFNIRINKGAGAFVCGEGSALTASIEGERGMPRVKPPRTVEKGLWGKPTVLNNVETFANVPLILKNGSDWYKSIGPEKSPGTKAFALTGNVNNTGLIEVPMGTPLGEIIFDIGGGVRDGKKFKAVQIGGPSGGCLTAEHLNLPLDFDSLKKVGAMIGSGGLVVMDEDTCMVEVARYFMNFTQNESCGKCVPCREGTKRMLAVLERIVAGKGTLDDLDMLEELADTISSTALCGLGKSAAGPVISTLKYFREEYLAHVVDKKCPTHTCKAMNSVVIRESLCRGCSKCTRVCPVGAIEGKVKQPYVIRQEACIKCGACIEACPFSAIEEV